MAKKSKKFPIETIFVILAVVGIVLILYLSQKAEKPVASVNGQEITTADLDYILSTVPEQQRQSLTKENLTEIAISNLLVRQEIIKRGLKVSEEEVDALISRFLEQNQITMDEYLQLLEQQGTDINFIKNLYAEQLLTYKLMNETVLNEVKVSDDEIESFYEMYKMQINGTYEEVKSELAEILKIQKAQQSFILFVQQLRSNAEIKYY